MNCYIPMTLLANDLFFSVARPRSPILTEPVVPVMNMLSHLRSLCITGGLRVCKKCKPFRIWRHQFFSTFMLIFLNLLMYLRKINGQWDLGKHDTGLSRNFHDKFPWLSHLGFDKLMHSGTDSRVYSIGQFAGLRWAIFFHFLQF